MECRTLDLTLISAKGIKNSSFLSNNMDTYAVVSITGSRLQQPYKLRTPVDKNGGSEPNWNYPMKLKVEEAAGQQNALTLVIKVKAVRLFGSKNLGEARVPIKVLLEGVTNEGKSVQFVNYELRKPSGKINGVVSFSYKFGEKFEEPVMAYPPGFNAARAYHVPPVQQPQVVQQAPVRSNNSGLGLGLGAGLLGGLLVGDMISSAGCGGGGGCGGGCGGGGCGGGGCGS